MKQMLKRFRMVIVCMAGLLLMALFTACAGVTTTNGTVSITGKIQSVDVANGTVTLNVQGQSQPIVIKGLSSAQVSALQSQVGKTYTITATQNSDGSYQIAVNGNPVLSTPNTPEGIQTADTNETPSAPEQGSISFIGKVQSVNSSVVSMPNGSTLSMNIVNGQTDLSDFNGSLPGANQLIKVDANSNSDGSFTATKLSATDSGDTSNSTKLNTVDFQGVTTSAVGSDGVIHFKVGNKSFSFTTNSNTDLGDFNNNAQSIQANQAVKVEVLFNGATGSVVKVSNANS